MNFLDRVSADCAGAGPEPLAAAGIRRSAVKFHGRSVAESGAVRDAYALYGPQDADFEPSQTAAIKAAWSSPYAAFILAPVNEFCRQRRACRANFFTSMAANRFPHRRQIARYMRYRTPLAALSC